MKNRFLSLLFVLCFLIPLTSCLAEKSVSSNQKIYFLSDSDNAERISSIKNHQNELNGGYEIKLVNYRNGIAKFTEGDEFTFLIEGEEIKYRYLNNSSRAWVNYPDRHFADESYINGVYTRLAFAENGDLQAISRNVSFDPSKPKMSVEELESKMWEYVKKYNRNVLTGDPMLNPEDYYVYCVKYPDNDELSRIKFYLRPSKKMNGWQVYSRVVVFLNQNGDLFKLVFENPGWINNAEIPEYPGDAELKQKTKELLSEFDAGFDYDDIRIDYSEEYYKKGIEAIMMDSPAVMQTESGQLGVFMRVIYCLEGEAVGEDLLFIPFESLKN